LSVLVQVLSTFGFSSIFYAVVMLFINRRFSKKDAAEKQLKAAAQEKEALAQKERQILMRSVQNMEHLAELNAAAAAKQDPMIAGALTDCNKSSSELNEYLIQQTIKN
jgi:hypothetical protein